MAPSIAEAATHWRRLPAHLALELARQDQDARWSRGECPRAEEYLAALPALAATPEDALALIHGEILNRAATGETCDLAEYARRFPDLDVRIRELLALDSDLVQPPATQEHPQPAAPRASSVPEIPGLTRLQRIKRGGMGVVYRATIRQTGAPVAVKFLCDRTAPPESIVRFLQEREIVARLDHPNVVRFLDTGTIQGQPYLVTEWLEGGTLADRTRGRPQDPTWSASLIATLTLAVAYAHSRGIIHRDLKPANILFTADAAPKIADFGVARLLFSGGSVSSTGQLLGTLRYMPPEQVEGRHREIGPPTDVYALGAILYELLAGVPPVRGKAPLALIPAIRNQVPPLADTVNPAVPHELAMICACCLAKRQEDRYPTADDLRAALDRAVEAPRASVSGS